MTRADAGSRTGQGLARLLNATGGMVGKGSKTLFVITTNEPISRFHQAVVRPGRCVSRLSSRRCRSTRLRRGLDCGAADAAKRVTMPATVAELFAMAA
jgi:hypothetical protein